MVTHYGYQIAGIPIPPSAAPPPRGNRTVSYFSTRGGSDAVLYAPAPVVGSANGSPNTNGYILEARLPAVAQHEIADAVCRPSEVQWRQFEL